jgi:hypothetical protein
MKHEHYYREHKKDVNESGSDMERQEPEQPQDDQNRSDYPEHRRLLLPSTTFLCRHEGEHLGQDSNAAGRHHQVSLVWR